jgi:hypothetical protein
MLAHENQWLFPNQAECDFRSGAVTRGKGNRNVTNGCLNIIPKVVSTRPEDQAEIVGIGHRRRAGIGPDDADPRRLEPLVSRLEGSTQHASLEIGSIRVGATCEEDRPRRTNCKSNGLGQTEGQPVFCTAEYGDHRESRTGHVDSSSTLSADTSLWVGSLD